MICDLLNLLFTTMSCGCLNQLLFPFKLKGILSQSQDKALRRIGELREVSCD